MTMPTDVRGPALSRLKAMTTLPEQRVAEVLDATYADVAADPARAALPVPEIVVMRAAVRLWAEERALCTERVA